MKVFARMPFLAALFLFVFALTSAAEEKYDPGATASEIKVGNIMPYTGAFSEYGATGRAESAYFQMINDRGGINGRKIRFISLDSGSDTGKAVELAHQLIEQDQVLLTMGIWGAPANLAVRSYFNEKKVPQLFVAATDSAFNDPSHFPWTMGFQVSKRTEGLVYAKYISKNKPGAESQYSTRGIRRGDEWPLAYGKAWATKAAAMIVKEAAFDYSVPVAFDAGSRR